MVKGKARVILPITDPYVVHHGALGIIRDGLSGRTTCNAAAVDCQACLTFQGVDVVLSEGRKRRQSDMSFLKIRIGDIVIISTENTVLGNEPGPPRLCPPSKCHCARMADCQNRLFHSL